MRLGRAVDHGEGLEVIPQDFIRGFWRKLGMAAAALLIAGAMGYAGKAHAQTYQNTCSPSNNTNL